MDDEEDDDKPAVVTTIDEAIKRWGEKNKKDPAKATDIGLQCQYLPIEKMDNHLQSLVACRKLSLSSNMIEKITGLEGMKNLRVLSLARNHITDLDGIEVLGETLEQLWLSYNTIERLRPLVAMKALLVLYLTFNNVEDWAEFNHLAELPKLVELTFMGNPLHENMDETLYREEVERRLPNLKKIDAEIIIRPE